MTWSTQDISLAYTSENLGYVISQGILGSSSAYSHHQLINWCISFSQHFDDPGLNDPQRAKYQALADDISVQWELHLAGHYSLEQMSRIDLNDLILPKSFFQHWLDQLELLNHDLKQSSP